jgi:hypothetical protein
MERREQYDPEDIESLLQERSFDELLEEERAYVLRHLSGREEYEQMRALLRHVREDDRQRGPIVADDAIRNNVMQAFRAQQQPQWRVWLNSIGGIFTPGDGYAMWRPALALGMLVVLFGIGFWLINGPLAGPTNEELAEVRRQKAEEPLPVKKAEAADTVTAIVKEQDGQQQVQQEPVKVQAENNLLSAKQMDDAVSAEAPVMDAEIAEDLDDAKTPQAEKPEFVEMEEKQEADAVQFQPAAGSHVVTQDELARNASVANATGRVAAPSIETKSATMKQKAIAFSSVQASKSRSVAQDPQLLELLSAGW